MDRFATDRRQFERPGFQSVRLPFDEMSSDADFDEFLADWQMEFEPSSAESAKLAGHHFRRYLDRGYLRDYFSDLMVLNPSAHGAGQ